MKPRAIDLFCGLGGWTEGLLAEGYAVTGYDIEAHEYGDERYPGELVLQDVMALNGAQFRDAALIVASPPCQEYSYMAMPWKRAKAKAAAIRADSTGAELARLNQLFDACFRIQREASAAAGRHIPMVVENVRGAQDWVGPAAWNFGSFYLWGDVPALMPNAIKATKNPGFRFDGSKQSFQTASVANHVPGHHSYRGDDGVKVPSEAGRRTDVGNGARFTSRDCGVEGRKAPSGTQWFNDGPCTPDSMASMGSKSPARKAASAKIAKIPFVLSSWIARTYRPSALEIAS